MPARSADRFDPVAEGERHGLRWELALELWQQACREATDTSGALDAERAKRAFLELVEGEDGFFRKMKLLAYKQEAERLVPRPDKRVTLSIKIAVNGEPDKTLSYRSVSEAVGDFAEGIPECTSCP